ncbi:helix-turn-helix domain-containing protein [Ochrobactrum sp. S46]|nr:helix-turn-helix domain-containing protein [Ochrobactrum sp. S45]MBK0046373.1 helix-turn-helix domain-containing protein [Ochrobactrum sp. S46]
MRNSTIPTYHLYGDDTPPKSDFRLHCETIFSRSNVHNFEISLHRHEGFYQFLYIEAGTGIVNFDGELHRFETPCAILVPPDFNHGFAFSRDVRGHILTVLRPHMPFAEEGAIGAAVDWLKQPQLVDMTTANDAHRQIISTLFQEINGESEAHKPYKNKLLEALTKATLTYLLRSVTDAPSHAKDSVGAFERTHIERLQLLIDRYYRKHKPASFYARELGVSSAHLNRSVQKFVGMTTQHMIAHKLLDTAKRELVVTSSSVAHIAYELGFSDPAYFSRFFLKMARETPRSFRIRERVRLALQAMHDDR